MITGHDFAMKARQYIGTPFKHQGRTVRGLDCIGLAIITAVDLDIVVHDKTDYNPTPDPAELIKNLRAHCVNSNKSDLVPGMLLLMRFVKEPQHIAIVTPAGIVHSYSKIGKVVEHGLNKVWKRRVFGAYKIKGVRYE